MGLLSKIGKWTNQYTGATDASQRAQRYALQSMAVNNAYQKEAAQNAHQWEMADLQKAGLNPALTATGGSGASLSGGGIASGGAQMAHSDLMSGIVNMLNSTRQTNAQTRLNDAQALKYIAETDAIPKYLKNDTIRAMAQDISARANATNAQTNRQTANAGIGGKVFGNEHGGAITSALTGLAASIGFGGAAGMAKKGWQAYKSYKQAKRFGNFLNSIKN